MIDTHPGLNEETLLSIAISDVLAIILRPDQQDYQGTGVTVEVAQKLDVPRLLLIVNKVPAVFDMAEVKARVEQTYGCPVAAVLPHAEEMMTLASAGIFVLRYPDHPSPRRSNRWRRCWWVKLSAACRNCPAKLARWGAPLLPLWYPRCRVLPHPWRRGAG